MVVNIMNKLYYNYKVKVDLKMIEIEWLSIKEKRREEFFLFRLFIMLRVIILN